MSSIVAAVGAQLAFFNHGALTYDYTYDYWKTVLCVQIAQNLSIITACLPCLHPFIISVLAGRTKTDCLIFECNGKRKLKQYLYKKTGRFSFDPMSSQSSGIPIKEAMTTDYCRPLATYGLDRSSAHLNSQHFNHFPSNIATPIFDPKPPENVFMRHVEIPKSRPTTSASKDLPSIPKTLSEVGVLPIIDWDTDSSESGRDSPSRRPNSEYVFNRSKVISVPEEDQLYDNGQYWKKYYPPLPSPKMPKRPPGM